MEGRRLVWDGPDSDEYGVFGRRFQPSGSALGPEFSVSTYTTAYQVDPDVALDAAGTFVVVWESEGQDGDNRGVFARDFDFDSGAPRGSELQVNTSTIGPQSNSTVAVTDPSEFVVVWQSRVPGFEDEIWARRFGCEPLPGSVTGLRLEAPGDASQLHFTWSDEVDASFYTVFRDTEPGGLFLQVAGDATSSETGLLIPMPDEDEFFLVVGHNDVCGQGSKK